MKISGHKTCSAFDCYNIVNEEGLRKAREQVTNLHEQTRQIIQQAQLGTIPGTISINRNR